MAEDRINMTDEMTAKVAQNKRRMKLIEEYAQCDAKSAELNTRRKEIRETVEKLGDDPDGFQDWVKLHKKKTKGELRDYKLTMQQYDEAAADEGIDVQQQFWPDRAKAAEKREKRKADAAAEANKGSAGAPDPDKNPRSDPNKGGAKPRTGRKGEVSNVVQLQPPSGEQQQTEQQEGDAVLNGLTPETQAAQSSALNDDGTPKSQSQISQEKLEAAKLT